MTALDLNIDELREAARERPSYYGGYWPGEHGYLPVVMHSRDSDPLEDSNYRVAVRDLQAVADLLNPNLEPDDGFILQHNASHWAVGWVEQLWVADVPELVTELQSIREHLQDYPVLDETDYCELEHERFIDEIESWATSDISYALDALGHDVDDLPPAAAIAYALSDIHGAHRTDDLPPMDHGEWAYVAWQAAEDGPHGEG